jgi:hypothetical protein
LIGVFVQDFEVIDLPFASVRSHLENPARAETLLQRALRRARVQGEVIRGKVGPAGWPSMFSKRVRIWSGPLREHGDSVLLPLCWEATEGPSLFPRLDADLEAAPFGASQTQLFLRARYDPPGGAVGRRIDQMLLHRVAEATLRAFLTDICTALDTRGESREGHEQEAGPGS